jgi:hypothetical protein
MKYFQLKYERTSKTVRVDFASSAVREIFLQILTSVFSSNPR